MAFSVQMVVHNVCLDYLGEHGLQSLCYWLENYQTNNILLQNRHNKSASKAPNRQSVSMMKTSCIRLEIKIMHFLKLLLLLSDQYFWIIEFPRALSIFSFNLQLSKGDHSCWTWIAHLPWCAMLNSDISWFENSLDPDKLVSERPADQELHCFLLLDYLFVLILNILVNNFSVKSGRAFLGWTRTKHDRIKCLAQRRNTVSPVRLEPATMFENVRPLGWVVKHLSDQVKVNAMKQCVIVHHNRIFD